MVIVTILRFFITKLMYSPDSPALQKVQLSHKTLKKTLMEKEANFEKDEAPGTELDIPTTLEEKTKQGEKEGNALIRSTRIRKACEYLPEDAVKMRKAYYCNAEKGYLNRKVAAANPMAMMGNPDMMGNMMKQNVQQMFNMFLFTFLGNIFSGFIIAQVPFPLGQKFKAITQQGLNLLALDPSYVSSMSWCFLLIFGLQGVMGLIIGDSEGLDEMNAMMMGPQAQMMQGGMGGGGDQKNYQALFKSEKENYEILNYKFRLDDAEDAFLARYKKK